MPGLSPNTFKVVQLNAENLFLFLKDPTPRDWKGLTEKEWQKLSSASGPNKSLVKTLWLAETVLFIDADVICINEVGGEESLTNFAKLFLNDLYEPFIIEGNSDRGIDVGYLVRRGLELRSEIHTHKDRPLDFNYPLENPKESLFFSRDCSELRLFTPGSTDPSLIFLLVHLKSKLDPDGIDPQGKNRREAEFNTLMKIYSEVRARSNPPPPVIVLGDFNGCARPDQLAEEFSMLTTTDLESVIHLVGVQNDTEGATQVQVSRGGAMTGLQIDYIFVSPELKEHLLLDQSKVFRYLSDLRVELPLPTNFDQRLKLPSDHYPVVATFKDFLK